MELLVRFSLRLREAALFFLTMLFALPYFPWQPAPVTSSASATAKN
jgi:hypothetical protein